MGGGWYKRCLFKGGGDRGTYGSQYSDHKLSYNTALLVAKRVWFARYGANSNFERLQVQRKNFGIVNLFMTMLKCSNAVLFPIDLSKYAVFLYNGSHTFL